MTQDAWVFSGNDRLSLADVDHFEPPARLTPSEDFDTALACAFDTPVASASLRTLAGDCKTVAIAIPDASRPCPSARLLPPLLGRLNAAGVADEAITVLIGCGLHRATDDAEKRRLVGDVIDRVTVSDAQAQTQESIDLGQTTSGIPVYLNRLVANADLAITVGVVEPHLYAGFSGGVKGVAIGCAGHQTIAATHHPAFISQPGVDLGSLRGNPFQVALNEIAARSDLGFAINIVAGHEDEPAAIACGDPAAVQATLAAAHRAAWFRPVPGRFDVIVAGVPAPKSESLYQASRAATYLGLAAQPALEDDGLILLACDMPSNAGDGPGELNFAALVAGARPDEILSRGLREPLGPGGQRAFVVARVLQRYRVGVLGAGNPAFLEALGISAYATLDEALDESTRRLGRRPRVLAVADAITTIVHAS